MFRKIRSYFSIGLSESAFVLCAITLLLFCSIALPEAFNLPDTGKFYMIYHPFRLIELIALLQGKHLEPKRIQFVHSKAGEEAKMVLIEALKNSGAWLKVEPPLYICEEDGEYTAEMKRIYEE